MHNTYSDSYPTQQSKAMYNEGFQKVGAGMVVMGKYIDNDPKRRRVTRETHIELHRKRTKYATKEKDVFVEKAIIGEHCNPAQ